MRYQPKHAQEKAKRSRVRAKLGGASSFRAEIPPQKTAAAPQVGADTSTAPPRLSKAIRMETVNRAATPSQIRAGDIAADIAVIVLLVGLLLCALFFAYDADNMVKDAISMTAVLAIMVITYFTSLTVGLVINIAAIFIYATYLIVSVLTQGAIIEIDAYFFMIMGPVLTAAVGVAFRKNSRLEAQNIELLERIEKRPLIDATTGFRIKNSLQLDLEVYRSIAVRFHVNIMFVLWAYRYPTELKSILGKDGCDSVAQKMAAAAKKAFRKGDILYVVSDYVWGALMLCPQIDNHAVIDRIREQFDMKYFAGEKAPRIDLKFGIITDGPDETGHYPDADGLIEAAEAAMEFDV